MRKAYPDVLGKKTTHTAAELLFSAGPVAAAHGSRLSIVGCVPDVRGTQGRELAVDVERNAAGLATIRRD